MYKSIQFILISSTLFSYHILMSTYLSSSLAGQSISLLVAPTYFAFALALAGSYVIQKIKTNFDLSFCLSFLTLLSFILSILLINFEIQSLAHDILQLGSKNAAKPYLLEFYISTFYSKYSISISLLMSFPFLAYGLYFSNYLENQRPNGPLRALSLELVGGMIGVVFSLLLLNYFGWEVAFLTFFGLAGIASLLYYLNSQRFALALMLLILLATSIGIKNSLSPVSDLHISARDFSSQLKVDLEHESWNSFSKIQTLKLSHKSNGQTFSKKKISIGDGTGHAQMPVLRSPEKSITAEITTFLKPKKVLILFAGAGYEIVKMSESASAPEQITGVEINSHVIEHGLLGSDGALAEVLKNKNYQLVQSDARQFLEKSDEKYDAILFSWSGATVAYYSGAIMHTTQFVFTREAFQAAYQRLAPNGHLIILGGSKVNLINHMHALSIKNLQNKITLLEPQYDIDWKRGWDNHILIVAKEAKEQGYLFSDLLKFSTQIGYRVVISPQSEPNKNYLEVADLIQSTNWPASLEKLNAQNQLHFKSHTDDNPFIYHMFPNYRHGDLEKMGLQLINFHVDYAIKDFIIIIFIFSLGALLFSGYRNRSIKSKLTKLAPLLSFLFGIFSTSLLLFSIYKSVLYLGYPNFSLGLGIMVSMSSSLVCLYAVQKYKLNDRIFFSLQLIGAILLLGLIFLSQLQAVKHFIFQLPLEFQTVILYFIFLVVFSLNSLFYPYLILQNQNNLRFTKQIIAFDVMGSGLASLLLPLLIEDHGLSSVMVLTSSVVLILLAVSLLFKKFHTTSQ